MQGRVEALHILLRAIIRHALLKNLPHNVERVDEDKLFGEGSRLGIRLNYSTTSNTFLSSS
jgi:hypothetical protein